MILVYSIITINLIMVNHYYYWDVDVTSGKEFYTAPRSFYLRFTNACISCKGLFVGVHCMPCLCIRITFLVTLYALGRCLQCSLCFRARVSMSAISCMTLSCRISGFCRTVLDFTEF